jgi:YVTN family beta-propeller protein
VSPDGRSVYVGNMFSMTISQYDVRAGGALSPKTPAAVPAGGLPAGVAVAPDGKSVYAANFDLAADNPNGVSQYNMDRSGRLSFKDPEEVVAGGGPSAGLAVSPDGKSVYVANSGSDTVSQYDVGASGALSPKRVDAVGTGDEPSGVAVTPDGRSVYVANFGDPTSGGGSVSQYDVGSGGELSLKRPRSVSAGSHPVAVTVSSDGGSAYVTSGPPSAVSGFVFLYDVGDGGALTPKDTGMMPAGTRPSGLAVTPVLATARADVLTGTAGDNVICGLGGADVISGLGGEDALFGDRCGTRATVAGRRSVAAARARHDVLRGGAGRDRLYGGAGHDRLHGGPGRDRLRGGPGRDRLRGGVGHDVLHVRGGERDHVHCGNGRDAVRADRHDRLRGCERIRR